MLAIESNLSVARSWLTAALNVMSIQWSRIAAISFSASRATITVSASRFCDPIFQQNFKLFGNQRLAEKNSPAPLRNDLSKQMGQNMFYQYV